MFIPMIFPILKNYDNIDKKEIIYSDTVLNLNDLGTNIKINTISNIDKNDFEKCLKIILETNKDVMFKTIQYSEQKKQLYFYTDRYINTDYWYESNYTHYKPVNNKEFIINEINSILKYQPTKNENYISILSYYKFIRAFNSLYKDIINKHLNIFTKKMKKTDSFPDHTFSFIYFVDGELKLTYTKYNGCGTNEIIFRKKNDDLYIVKSTSPFDRKILYTLGNEISAFYDEIKFYEKYTHIVHTPRVLNSKFKVHLTDWYVRLELNKDIAIEIDSISNSYNFKVNSNVIYNILKDNYNKIFENIFISIDDIEELKELLFKYRKDELEAILKKEKKEEKILSLKRKYLPWFYK